MATMIVDLNGERLWPDLQTKPVIHFGNDAPPIRVAVLERGTSGGLPSIAIRLDMPDGGVVLAETTARLFVLAGRMIDAKFPGLFDDDKDPVQVSKIKRGNDDGEGEADEA